MNRYLLTALTSAALLVPASGAHAAPGDLDSSFDGDGKALLDFGAIEAGDDVAIQPDGKIVIAGKVVTAGKSDFLVVRLNRDGTLDNTFSDDGRIAFGFSQSGNTTDDDARAVALAPDGSIVVAGLTGANAGDGNGIDTAVARLTSGGALDASFDGDGKQTVDYGQDDEGEDVAVRSDGSVVVGSTALIGSDRDLGVARLTGTGRPDTTWSANGRAAAHFGADEQLHGIAITPDGGVAAAGVFQNVADATDTVVARWLPNGELDETGFAGRGKLLISVGSKDGATDVAVQPDGKLVLAVSLAGKNAQGQVVRLTPTGAFDDGYADHGLAQAGIEGPHDFRALTLTPRQHAVVVGQVSSLPNPANFVSAEFEPTGTPDRAYPQSDGLTKVDFGASEIPNGVAVHGDRAVVVGLGGGNIPVAAFEIDEPPLPEPTPQQGDNSAGTQSEQPQPPVPPAPVADTTAPLLSKLKLKTVRGTEKGTFKLSESASVRVTVQRKVKRGKRTRLVAARTITLKGKAGSNAFKVKRLKAGSYRLTLKATDGAGNRSKALRKAFALKKQRR